MSHETCINKFKIGRKLGQGSFGKVYIGTHTVSGQEVALKVESSSAENPQVLKEAKLLANELTGGLGIPTVHWSGTELDHNVMAIDLLGPSLEELFGYCGKKLSLKTTLMLGDQMINRVEYVHSKHHIHRDMKPENFLIGLGKRANLVYLVDYGLAKKYRNPKTLQHIQYSEKSQLTGTARYASINTHLGIEQSRRDDLESIGYLLVYFARGALPWQGLKANTKKEKYERIMAKKISTPVETLCKSLPEEFATFLRYCRSLRYEEMPNYKFLRGLLRDLMQKESLEYDLNFDWVLRNYQPKYSHGLRSAHSTPYGSSNHSRSSRNT
jgi:casein kinase 1